MKIALLGSAPSSRLLAPFNDPAWTIWACSPANYDLPRVDAWFELHSLRRKISPGNKPYIELIEKHPLVYINKRDPMADRLPNAVGFPFDELIEIHGRDFFSSSVAWMFAFALQKKPKKIGMWGIDMVAEEEYAVQRPGVKFFVHEAERRGIQVYAPPESCILQPMPLYALKEQEPEWWWRRARKKELEERIAVLDKELDEKDKERLQLLGAYEDLKYVDQAFCPVRKR